MLAENSTLNNSQSAISRQFKTQNSKLLKQPSCFYRLLHIMHTKY